LATISKWGVSRGKLSLVYDSTKVPFTSRFDEILLFIDVQWGAFLLIPGLIDLVVISSLFFRWIAQIEAKTRTDEQKIQ
jgi:hypothetical protein